MKIKLRIIIAIGLLSLFSPTNTNSQAPAPTIVHDPKASSNALSMLTVFKNVQKTVQDTKAHADSLMTNAQFLQDIRETGIEVKRLYFLLESIVCATDAFDLHIDFVRDIVACNQRLNIDVTISRLDGIPKQIEYLLSGVLKMTKYESKTKLKEINDDLEKTANELNVINDDLEQEALLKIEDDIASLPFSARHPILWEHETGERFYY